MLFILQENKKVHLEKKIHKDETMMMTSRLQASNMKYKCCRKGKKFQRLFRVSRREFLYEESF